MFFWDVVRRRLVVGYRRFGTIRRSFADIYLRLCIAVVFYNITFCVCVCVCVCWCPWRTPCCAGTGNEQQTCTIVRQADAFSMSSPTLQIVTDQERRQRHTTDPHQGLRSTTSNSVPHCKRHTKSKLQHVMVLLCK